MRRELFYVLCRVGLSHERLGGIYTNTDAAVDAAFSLQEDDGYRTRVTNRAPDRSVPPLRK